MKCILLLTAVLLDLLTSARQVAATKVNFFHISDLHLDTLYSVNGSYSERCHESANLTSGDGLNPAGDYRCDPPLLLIDSALKAMATADPEPDFILWTGDSNAHWVDGPNLTEVYSNLKRLTKLIRENFPETTVIPVLGNHDTYKPDNYPDRTAKDSTMDPKFYDYYVEEGSWGEFIPKESVETFKKCGFYRYPLPNNMTFFVLNTNLYYGNKLPLNYTDPCGQLQWLEDELDNLGEYDQAFVAAHVPPGYFERVVNVADPMFNVENAANITRRLVNLLGRAKDKGRVRASFFGHTHTDTFRLFPSEVEGFSSLAFIASSITPALYFKGKSYGVNPSFRRYEYDTEREIVLDYETTYLDLNEVATEMNAMDSDSLADKWVSCYHASSSFKVNDLSPKSMMEVYQRMLREPDGKVFRDYFLHNTMLSHENATCNSTCHATMMCAMVAYERADMQECLVAHGVEPVTNVVPTTTQVSVETTTVVGNSSEEVTTLPPPVVVETTLKPEEKVETTTVQSEREQPTTIPPTTKKPATLPPVVEIVTKAPTRTPTRPSKPLNLNPESKQTAADPGQESQGQGHGVLVGFSIVIVLAIAVGGLIWFRRMQRRRRRMDDEFLLTDQAFRASATGYAALDDF